MRSTDSKRETDAHNDLASQYVTFRIGGLLFGIDVAQVQEVLRHQPMTPVPLAPQAVKGLVNLRGQIITAIDLRSLLRLEPYDREGLPMKVVIRAAGEVLGLMVDSIGDVLEIDPSCYEDVPETLPGSIRNMVQGVFKLDHELMLVLNGDSCVQGSKAEL
jgi:purine-binding chemotaxis protein CheW